MPTNHHNPCRYDGPSIFHIGYIKTGTTFLQNQVFSRSELGLGLAGGEESRATLINELVLKDGYDFDPSAAGCRLAALEEPSRALGLVPIWSDETLLGNVIERRYDGQTSAARLLALPGPKKVLITIREQRSFALSAYREYIKQGGRNTLDQFIGTGREPASFTPILRTDFLCYDRAINFYRAALGKDGVLVLPSELLSRAPETFAWHLGAFLERDLSDLPVERTENKGRAALTLPVARRLNALTLVNPLSPKPTLSRRIARKLVVWMDRFTPAALNSPVEQRYRHQISQRYSGVFLSSNAVTQDATPVPLADLGYEIA
ncbi:MAG: hypothetical protein AAGA26_02180 [Pseudomonadota bacterium]